MIKNKLYIILCVLFMFQGFELLVLSSQKQRNLEKAKEILENNPLIDG